MTDRTKTIVALGILLSVCIAAGLIVTRMVFGNRVISPVPEESVIKIIFVTPTPQTPSMPPQGPGGQPSTSSSVKKPS